MKFKILGLIVSMLLCLNVYAANQRTGKVKIVSLGNWVGNPGNPNEVISIQTDQTEITNPGNCPKTNAYVLLDASDVSKTLVLTAFTAQTNIILNIWGGCTSDGYPQIVQVEVVQ